MVFKVGDVCKHGHAIETNADISGDRSKCLHCRRDAYKRHCERQKIIKDALLNPNPNDIFGVGVRNKVSSMLRKKPIELGTYCIRGHLLDENTIYEVVKNCKLRKECRKCKAFRARVFYKKRVAYKNREVR